MRPAIGALSMGWMAVWFACAAPTPEWREKPDPSVAAIRDINVGSGLVLLNQDLQPSGPVRIVAEIYDSRAPLQEVTLEIKGSDIALPMRQVDRDHWVGELSEEDLGELASKGKTRRVEAQIVTRNAAGDTMVSRDEAALRLQSPS